MRPNPFHDDEDRERAAEFADRVVLGLCALIAAWMLPDVLAWISGGMPICLR